MINEEWVLKMSAFMKKENLGILETTATDEEINEIKSRYNKEAIYYTETINEPLTNDPPNIITVEQFYFY